MRCQQETNTELFLFIIALELKCKAVSSAYILLFTILAPFVDPFMHLAGSKE